MKFLVTGRREALYSSLKRVERRTLGTTNLSASLLCLGRSWKIPFLVFKPPQSLPSSVLMTKGTFNWFQNFCPASSALLVQCMDVWALQLTPTFSPEWNLVQLTAVMSPSNVPSSNAPCPVAKSYTTVAKKEAADRCREMKGEGILEERQQRS